MKQFLILALVGFLALARPAFALDKSLKLPEQAAPVVDEVGLIEANDAARLETLLRNIKQRSDVEITVYIPASLQEHAIEDFSIAVAEKWKLGRKKEDKALLFVIAPHERKMRLEVGYGLEGDLTDAFTRRVLDDYARPYFRQGQYANGIFAALSAIQEKVHLGISASDQPEPLPERGSAPGKLPPGIVLVLILIFIVIRILIFFSGGGGFGGGGYIGRGGWGGSGGGGGGSWGGGGGGFGGGGSSSDW